MLIKTKGPDMAERGALETIVGRLKTRMDALELPGREVSRRAGLGLSFVNDILSGSSKNPAERRLQAVAEVLECDLAYLYGTQEEPRLSAAVVQFPGADRTREAGHAMAATLPLFTANWADAEGFFSMAECGDESTGLPFDSVAGGYAVMVPDETMAPRYAMGDLVFANPRRPVGPGAYVVIRMKDDRAIIRRVVKSTAEGLEAESLAGDGESRLYSRAQIKSVHRITTSSEN